MSVGRGRVNFPFSAFVDQQLLKLALILNAINPFIGGLLIRGPKGSGKTTAVRGLVDILPVVEVVESCPFNCSPRDPSNMCEMCRKRYDTKLDLPVKKKPMRVITLPLGATEDRVVGTLDIERALKEGVRAFQPGILAEANQNILYVDEINLLPDHIVDDLLDAAASGWNVTEREAVSVSHPSRFILIGTMNPEEGELRPQLLDRLSLSVTIQGVNNPDQRVQIIERNMEFKRDPVAFIKGCEKDQQTLRNRILKAKQLLPKVQVPRAIMYIAAHMCIDLSVDGQRPDIIMIETAKTIASYDGKLAVEPENVKQAAVLTLGHRTRKGGFEGPASIQEIEGAFDKALSRYRDMMSRWQREKEVGKERGLPLRGMKGQPQPIGAEAGPPPEREPQPAETRKDIETLGVGKRIRKSSLLLPTLLVLSYLALNVAFMLYLPSRVNFFFSIMWAVIIPYLCIILLFKLGKLGLLVYKTRILKNRFVKSARKAGQDVLFQGKRFAEKLSSALEMRRSLPSLKVRRKDRAFLAGKRGITLTTLTRGRYKFYEAPKKPSTDIALIPTIRTAAMHGHVRHRQVPLVSVRTEDLRTKVREYRAPVTLILVLDVSGSMAPSLPIIAKAVTMINRDAYRKRDRVGVIAFKEENAYILNHPTSNVNVVAGNIKRLGVSGSTPLADGLLKASEVIKQERRKNRHIIPLAVLVSDCLANVPLKASPTLMDEGRRVFGACEDALHAARLLARNRIPVVVINPFHIDSIGGITHGTPLAKEIAKVTNGRYYGFRWELGMIHAPPARAEKIESIILDAIRDENFLLMGPSPMRVAY